MKKLVEGFDHYIADLESPTILAFHTLYPDGYNLSLETHTSFKHNDVSKEKMRKPKSAEARANMSKAKKGKPNGRKGIFTHSNETKIKIRARFKDIPLKPETLEKRRKTLESMDLTHPIVTCPHCGKNGGERAMKRWHFDLCKFKGK